MSKFEKNLTEGSVTRLLVAFAVPFLFSNLLQALYSVSDMVVIGQFNGPVGLSAVQVGSQVIQLITNMASGLCVGATVLVAQFQGAGKNHDQKQVIGTLLTLFLFLSLGVTVLMFVFNNPILRLLGADKKIFADSAKYMMICSAGSVFIFGYNAVSGILRGMGDSKRPLVFVAVAAVSNVILDILFVGVFGMGVTGAALSTVLAQALSCVWSIIYLKKGKFVFDFNVRSFRINREKLKLIFKVGLPSTVQFSITGISFLVLTGLSNKIYPVVGSAILGIGSKLNTFGILACIAMSSSISSMAAQNIGADKHDRAKKTMWVGMFMAFCVSAAVFTVVMLFPNGVMKLFMSQGMLGGNDLDFYNKVLEVGPKYLRLISFDYLLACVFFCTNGLATGSGHTMFSLANSAVNALVFRVPMAYIFSSPWGFNMGIYGIAVSLGFAPVFSAVIGLIYVQSGKWKKPVVDLKNKVLVE